MPPKKAEAENKHTGKKPMSTITMVAFTVMTLFCVPYCYYAVKVNIYGQENQPANLTTPFPKFTEFWQVLLGAFVTQTIRFVVHKTMPGFFAPIAKGDDEESRKRYTVKACEHTYRGIYFTGATIWGWYVLKDSPYLYESLGGPPGGDLLKMRIDTVILDYPTS